MLGTKKNQDRVPYMLPSFYGNILGLHQITYEITNHLLIYHHACFLQDKAKHHNSYRHVETTKDSLAFYFPINIFSDIPRADSFVQNWYSSALYSFKEPVLSQSFVGHDIYRFVWLRSFHRPVVFTLHQSEAV